MNDDMADSGYQDMDDDIDALFGGEDDFFDQGEQPQNEPPTSVNGSGEVNADENNDDDFAKLMQQAGVDGGGGDGEFGDLNAIVHSINDRELETGEKADDAVDYADIDDDSLADEEEIMEGGAVQAPTDFLAGINDSAMELNDDDLFGPSSPTDQAGDQLFLQNGAKTADVSMTMDDRDSDLASETGISATQGQAPTTESLTEEEEALYRMQRFLLERSNETILAPESETLDDWLKTEFPDFKRHEAPFWNKLFPQKHGRFKLQVPSKPPKPVQPSKVNLELEHDQKTLFNSTAFVAEPQKGMVKIEPLRQAQVLEELSDESDDDELLPGGVTMQDLEFMCTEFDTLSGIASPEPEALDLRTRIADEEDDMFGFDNFNDFEHPVKKRRLGLDPRDVISIHQYDMPAFDEPERLTARLSSQVVLDLNDPLLLVEEIDPEVARAKARLGERSAGATTLKDRMNNRFKTSNDAEYDALKQNHQHKIRGQLSHLSIDHALPATRLQYPYYKVKLSVGERRNYHRHRMQFKHPFTFSKPNKRKRKHLKGLSTKDIYSHTKDMSFGDNSTAVLLEYSEELPIMLSQTGMGNKIVNYYRRQQKDDNFRPKMDVGEAQVLLPEDKGPFQNFGHVDPGETVTAIYNSLYRAPIYDHKPKAQDFLVVRETTGLNGPVYYLRGIDYLYVVGQELPSVQVPGTHSRMVTTNSKNRLKAISFRIARRKKSHRIRVEDVTKHFPDTSDMQNRQKMKEFMVFSKEHKEWEMKPGEAVPDEDTIQNMLKPEEICLLESMQVGSQYLHDAGYGENDDDDDDQDKEGENDSIEQQLAPWKTTKNFLQATQGKAMLKLYGEGDPSGRGEAFSFIKTSMKGGFRAQGASVNDVMGSKKVGGHSYNVANQQRSYDDSIRNIWYKQKQSLASGIEPTDLDMDGDIDTFEDNYNKRHIRDISVSMSHPTPRPGRRGDDETGTSFTRQSAASQAQKYLHIVRTVTDRDGNLTQQEHMETNPGVIKQYLKYKEAQEVNNTNLAEVVPTGDVEYDARQRKRIEEELVRLQKAQARRHQREKTKQAIAANADGGGAMSPDGEVPTPAGGRQAQATQRKCANCGQVGHIKTNKKLCPLLNGTIKQEDGFNTAAFMGAPPTL